MRHVIYKAATVCQFRCRTIIRQSIPFKFISIHFFLLRLENSSTQADSHRLVLGVVGQGGLAKFATDTGLLVTTEWYLGVEHVVCNVWSARVRCRSVVEGLNLQQLTQTVPALRALDTRMAVLRSLVCTAEARP